MLFAGCEQIFPANAVSVKIEHVHDGAIVYWNREVVAKFHRIESGILSLVSRWCWLV